MQTCIILLNWNGWRDTIECLESVFRLKSKDIQVVVCDNGSTDRSLEQIKAWAAGELDAASANPALSYLISPPVPKPIPCRSWTRAEAESGLTDLETPLVLIQTGANLGFAGGNNVGLRYALNHPAIKHFWLLNNDTIVDPDALDAMLRVMEKDRHIGICGSLNLSYYNPEQVQVEGGPSYNWWTARVKRTPSRTVNDLNDEPSAMDYVNGASMVVSRVFLEQVGLMEESYFLYFEELDWATRARGKFTFGYARGSLIYHKEGVTIGTNQDRRKRSLLADEYLSRNRILFTRRHAAWALPTVFISLCITALYRVCLRDLHRAKAMVMWGLRGMLENRSGIRPRVSTTKAL